MFTLTSQVIKEEIASSGQTQSIISIPFQTSLSNAVFSSHVREVSVRTSYAGNSSVKNFSVEDAASEKRHVTLFEQGISSHQFADNRFVLNADRVPTSSALPHLTAMRFFTFTTLAKKRVTVIHTSNLLTRGRKNATYFKCNNKFVHVNETACLT